MAQDKVITTEYLNTILSKLYNWMPFKRKNNGIIQNDSNIVTNTNEIALGSYNETDSNTILSIGIGVENNRKNAIKICKDGQIHIVTNFTNHTSESLQHLLDLNGVSLCDDYSIVMDYSNEDYLGKLLYLTKESTYLNEVYEIGLYIISRCDNGIKPFKIADSIKKELSNYYTKSEVEELITKISMGDLSGIYYTKSEIDGIVNSIDNRVSKTEAFVEQPITLNELEVIINEDINSDGNIG